METLNFYGMMGADRSGKDRDHRRTQASGSSLGRRAQLSWWVFIYLLTGSLDITLAGLKLVVILLHCLPSAKTTSVHQADSINFRKPKCRPEGLYMASISSLMLLNGTTELLCWEVQGTVASQDRKATSLVMLWPTAPSEPFTNVPSSFSCYQIPN